MIIHNVDQGTDEWFKVRAGKFTASLDFQQLCTGKSETRKKLLRKKAAERITGQLVQSEYTNSNMERGKQLESAAREAFEMQTGLSVRQVGFCELNEWAGASPDGLIGEDTGIEIKCKDVHTHLDCFLDGPDSAYKWQIQGNLWVTGFKKWYFVSYNPFFSHIDKQLFIAEIQRDESMIAQIAGAIEIAKKEVEAIAMIMTSNKI